MSVTVFILWSMQQQRLDIFGAWNCRWHGRRHFWARWLRGLFACRDSCSRTSRNMCRSSPYIFSWFFAPFFYFILFLFFRRFSSEIYSRFVSFYETNGTHHSLPLYIIFNDAGTHTLAAVAARRSASSSVVNGVRPFHFSSFQKEEEENCYCTYRPFQRHFP